ncbi:MAG: signal peptidase I [Eubacterium sp.]|nr:signal peptidase I [Eubacterium sp.]
MNLRFEEEAKKERRKKIIKEVLIYLGEICLVVGLAWIIVNFTLKKIQVIGSAMDNTLYNGEEVIANTFIYNFTSPSRGTVIAFYPEKNAIMSDEVSDSNIIIRRVLGLPGEKIKMQNGVVYINGTPTEEKYEFDRNVSSGQAEEEILLGDDEFFVLSDKRTDLDDSRSSSFTKVKKENIIGPVFLALNPFSLISGPEKEEKK